MESNSKIKAVFKRFPLLKKVWVKGDKVKISPFTGAKKVHRSEIQKPSKKR